jgi:hypothetical protein
MANPCGCSRNPLPTTLYLQCSDGNYSGTCAFKNTPMTWDATNGYYAVNNVAMGSCTGGSTFDFRFAFVGCNVPACWLKIYDHASGTFLESVSVNATTCNPVVAAFIPSGVEFGPCVCDKIPHFSVTENTI